MRTESAARPVPGRLASIALLARLLTVVGLAVDAYVHFKLAPDRPPADSSGGISQVTLFYAEGIAAATAALLVLVTAARGAYAFAFVVVASALAAVLLYYYVDVGAIGPLPNMYEPIWYADKVTATVAEAVALIVAPVGLLTGRR